MKKRPALWKIALPGISILFFLLVLADPVFPEDHDVPQLRSRITELEARVKHLESLLKKCLVTEQDASAIKYGWQNKKNWRKLEVGMNKDKVRGILGEPVKVIKGVQTLWYYPNYYCGYVSFDDSGRITGWNEP